MTAKAEKSFGDLATNVSLEDGLARTAEWVKHHGAREGKAFENVEVWKNMPPSWRRLVGKP